MEDFSTFDAVKILNVKHGRLKTWIESGFIESTRDRPWGDGVKRYFSREALYRIRLFQMFLGIGLSRLTAAEWIKKIPAQIDWTHWVRLDFKNEEVEVIGYSWTESGEVILKRDDRLDAIYFVNLVNLRKEVDQAIKDNL